MRHALYPARHPLPPTTVRQDGRFRFSAGSRRQGQRGRREAQHEEDLRAQGREGFLRPRPGCGRPCGTSHSRRGSPAVPRGAPAARERPRARIAPNVRSRSCAWFPRAPVSPSLCAVTKRSSATRESSSRFDDARSPGIGRAYPFRGARDLRARRVARGDLPRGGSRGPHRSPGAARASSEAAPADHARPTRDTHGGPKRDRAAARRVTSRLGREPRNVLGSSRAARSLACFFSRERDVVARRHERRHAPLSTTTRNVVTDRRHRPSARVVFRITGHRPQEGCRDRRRLPRRAGPRSR